MIEEDNLEIILESPGHVAPHILIASKAVRKHHSALASTGNFHVVAIEGHEGELAHRNLG